MIQMRFGIFSRFLRSTLHIGFHNPSIPNYSSPSISSYLSDLISLPSTKLALNRFKQVKPQMNSLRVWSGLRPFSTIAITPSPTTSFSIIHQQRFYAHKSYGGGEGDPKGENPQDQGSNPSAEKEHPGPPPPTEGQGSGGGPTKANETGHNTQDNASSSGTGSTNNESKGNQSKSGAQPKILDESVPTEQSDEVKQHNKEMDNRHDRAGTSVEDAEKDKVGKGYWSGEFHLLPKHHY